MGVARQEELKELMRWAEAQPPAKRSAPATLTAHEWVAENIDALKAPIFVEFDEWKKALPGGPAEGFVALRDAAHEMLDTRLAILGGPPG